MKRKHLLFLPILSLLVASCSTVKVATDYDTKADFTKHKTFAFYKKGIDKAKISDLDKRRVMRAVESELIAKGLQKSENPDILVNIFTKSRDRVNVRQNNFGYGFGWGWNPWMWNGMNNNVNVSQYTEGTLFIDLIDKEKKQLVWQGIGTGALLMRSAEKKEIRIKQFVGEIMKKYPPEKHKD
ncbi:uncharacterized protein DUF4136 [Lutibacter sp. Hel_I_33_5]|uniref:DUF4136 domain-containing protein n=1 Tax=Lutibacter sp. Hel_I_33_5 TaxID=1566289 RepID=UPI00119F55E0|nr:DUF4136 domain-containing protein [Lutibacter sp. Hel_I_33_5]TVZ57145.1 uncharacterized protein DUF4136 [Lutibacter sp. Hel_I_33_5]